MMKRQKITSSSLFFIVCVIMRNSVIITSTLLVSNITNSSNATSERANLNHDLNLLYKIQINEENVQLQLTLELHLESLSLLIKSGNDHQMAEKVEEVLTTMNNVAMSYENMGRIDEALDYYLKSMKIMKMKQASHQDLVTCGYRIANLFASKNDYEKALSYYESVLGLMQKVYGFGHPDSAELLQLIAKQYEKMRNFKRAYEFYNESLDMYRRAGGLDFSNSKFLDLLNDMNAIRDKLNTPSMKDQFHEENEQVRKNYKEEL